MKSAYATLGIPGNSDEEGIRQAYERATIFYSKQKLVENPALVEKLNEIKEAYKILSSSELRQMHDRKLSIAASSSQVRTAYVEDPEQSKIGFAFKVILVAAIAMSGIGIYKYQSHLVKEEARKTKLAEDIALKKQADEEEAKAAQEHAKAEAERARKEAIAENRERQLRAESTVIARQVQANQIASQLIQERQMQADRNAALQQERQRQYEAQQRAGADQRQIRNLCMLNYGRPNC